MTTDSLENRVAQLEKIVATQSEMILKLVEMMNHLGSEATEIKEHVASIRTATAAHMENFGQMLQRLAGQFGGDEGDNDRS